jgi:hypothetical protein
VERGHVPVRTAGIVELTVVSICRTMVFRVLRSLRSVATSSTVRPTTVPVTTGTMMAVACPTATLMLPSLDSTLGRISVSTLETTTWAGDRWIVRNKEQDGDSESLGGVAYTNSLNAGRDGSLKTRDRAVEGSDDVSFCGGHRCGKDVEAKGEESEKAGGELHFECDV